jgi:hypothetical protein
MAKKIDPKAKARKQKIYAAIGGVILLGVLAFQVPRTMKMLHQQGADAATSSTPASTSPTATSPSAAVGAGATPTAATGASGDLGDPDAMPSPQSGQLLAFGRFRSKDPFAQQIRDCSGDANVCPTGVSGGAATGKPPAQKPAAGTAKSAAPAGTSSTASARVTSATISVDGASETVSVGARFPAANPSFTLVSLTASSAKVGIAGGSLENGSATVTLKKGTPLTLMNTADGTRYVLRLLSTK